jgi:putative nucleotidyltransferase with HDIG domain
MNNTTRERIIKTFPEMAQIKNEDLRARVIEVWQRALETNKWDYLEDIPFHPEIPKDRANLVRHLRAVTTHCMKMAETMKDIYGYKINTDFVIAGGLLHDVCKAGEYNPKGSKSPIGSYLTHGVYGVHLCLEVGMPVEVTHIVASHTKKMGMPPKTIEAIIIHYCDLGDAQSIALQNDHDFF